MTQSYRLSGGRIDRSRRLAFEWDGTRYAGHGGDTLASALIANGVRLVGRSFKYHRPRGIFSAGPEEPSALVTTGRGARATPNTRATTLELTDGLEARPQNVTGSLRHDPMAVNDLLSPFLSAGFYYKTFMWPAALWERLYEPIIRRAAGLGALSGEPDPDTYDKGYLHCDVLVVGAGPAGLMAALEAGRAGARVILAEQDFEMGGRLLAETHEVEGAPGADWAAAALAELASMPNVRLMARTVVHGVFDHGIHGALETRVDGGPAAVLWRIYAARSVLAAGAIERPIAFGGNDRPGVMLAGAVRAYVNRWSAAPGRRVAVFTCGDDGWRTARDLMARGVHVAALVDVREGAEGDAGGARAITGHAVKATEGRHALRSVTLTSGERLDVDCLAVSGGWNPAVHLTCHLRGRPEWRGDLAAFVPGGDLPQGMRVAGAASGEMTLAAALRTGAEAGRAAASETGHEGTAADLPRASDEPAATRAYWRVRESKGRAWIDLQNDVTVKDVKLSHQEGFRSVEHLKRYTTLGMATDQGKTANVLGLAVMAEISGRTIAETGTTIFRPPYTPVPIGALAGRARGRDFRPVRLPPTHDWAERHGASFVEAGLWKRAEWYARGGERGWRDSVDREALAVRGSVGLCDVSTLGKIDVQGRDAAELLGRVYANRVDRTPVGRCRYGLMLREDGFAYDDGTAARLSETHFVVTTTTANAGLVMRNMEFVRQCLMPQADVHLVSTTDAWCQIAVAGPRSREVVAKLVDLDVSNEAFPFMACAECDVDVSGAPLPGRLFRISFSGELAYEIAVPARWGEALMEALMAAGEPFGIAPYGTEALGVLRIEKGHAAGAELNGTTTALNLGLGGMVSPAKDALGGALSRREGMAGPGALRLVGLRPLRRDRELRAGAHLMPEGATPSMEIDQGYVTSAAWSPTLGRSVGLAFLKGGERRMGETLMAYDPARGASYRVEVCPPHHVDPGGERQRG